MSILIKDMEMPNVCAYCFIDSSECNLYSSVNIWRERHPDCPLTELPPHGDLVDRDELLAEYDRQHKGTAGGARRIMEDAPTIIEAERSAHEQD